MPQSPEIGFENGKNIAFYPNCDINVWLRSCEKEEHSPIEGKLTGKLRRLLFKS